MLTIGMIGGMSWESTVSYYKAINESVKQRLGGFHSAKICLHSVNFQDIETFQREDRWDESAFILSTAAKSLEAAGADFFILCTNTMHKVADQLEAAVSIPFLHIADTTAEKLILDGRYRVGLLGTQFTMTQDFYKGRLKQMHGIEVLVPNQVQQSAIHEIIYSELCLGEQKDQSRQFFVDTIADLTQQGAEGIVLGCTEIALLLQQQHTPTPLYDTTQLHADAAVNLALSVYQ